MGIAVDSVKLEQSPGGARPLPPAFDALRASLRAAQAATPTAIASNRLASPRHQIAALHGLLGALPVSEENQSWLHGSFYTLNRLPEERAL